ncbi:MAG: hypothetical protein IJJ89_00250, partial [Eubacterium sp.]|nr:hypothetical protein [Eubacterium sp.]
LKVRGIGEKKAAKLFMKYKTIAKLKEASPEELAAAAGVDQETAAELWKAVRGM